MCHLANVQLHSELGDLEDAVAQQEAEVSGLHRARCEEVARLTHEAAALRRCLDPGGLEHWASGGSLDADLLLEGDGDSTSASSQLAALQQRLRLQRAELLEVQRGAADAEDEFFSLEERLEVLRGTQEQELHELRLRLPTPAQPLQSVRSTGALELQRCYEACQALRCGPGGELMAMLGEPDQRGGEDLKGLVTWLDKFAQRLGGARACARAGAPVDAG